MGFGTKSSLVGMLFLFGTCSHGVSGESTAKADAATTDSAIVATLDAYGDVTDEIANDATAQGLSHFLVAQSFMSGDQPLDDVTVQALRQDGQDNVVRLVAMRREIEKGIASGVHSARELARLDLLIDAVAGQLFASRSGLFWYTDLDAAQKQSQVTGKPILSLRMLGELTDEYSCANSRWFRILVYSNGHVAETMRSRFVLHWHMVRPVPKVTVNFGNGREIHTTLAGNSIHYVLDADGHILDAFPGLCGPKQFADWLDASKDLVAESKGWAEKDFGTKLSASYKQRASELKHDWRAKLASLNKKPAQAKAPPTVSKLIAELPLVASSFDGGGNAASWMRLPGDDLVAFDDRSIQLLRKLDPLHGKKNVDSRQEAFNAFVLNLRRMVTADGLLNASWHQPRVYQRLSKTCNLSPTESPAQFDVWVHASLFGEPLDDPWCGLLPPQHASGLSQNGIRESAQTDVVDFSTRPQGVFDERLQNLANELLGK